MAGLLVQSATLEYLNPSAHLLLAILKQQFRGLCYQCILSWLGKLREWQQGIIIYNTFPCDVLVQYTQQLTAQFCKTSYST